MSAQQVLDALGDPTRRRVLELLRDGPIAVGQIAEQLPVSRPAVSKHLKVLGESGLVTHVRVGTSSLYRIDLRGLSTLRDYLDGFWTDVLTSFAEHLEATPPGPPDESRRPSTTASTIAPRSSTVTRRVTTKTRSDPVGRQSTDDKRTAPAVPSERSDDEKRP